MEKVFVRRTSAPPKDNKYFLRTVNGGYAQCIKGKPEYFTGSVLANCVGYAWGRAAELEEDPNCNIGVPSSRVKAGKHNPTSAWAWMSCTNGRKTGKTPKLGAVAVWKSNSSTVGHVAIVSKINADGSWISEESGYGGYTFRNKTYNKNSARSGSTFLGFIYLNVDLVEELTPTQEFKIGDKVIINGNLYKSSNAATASGKVTNRTTTITRYAAGAKHPYNTTGDLGWMDAADIKLASTPTPTPTEELKVGDKVKIIAKGNSRKDGKGSSSGGIGWTRYILSVNPGQPYPYQVGSKSRITTGYYTAAALKKA